MNALIIIDMQNASFASGRITYDADGVISRINKLASYFRSIKHPVIFIQHDGTKQNSYIPGTNEWQIVSSLNRETTDLVVIKTVNDSFYNTDLKKVLDINNVDTLVITGYATDFCVDTTIRSALNKEYTIKVVKDGHTTFNRSFLDAETIVKHHNTIWEYLIPVKTKIEVKNTDELINGLNK